MDASDPSTTVTPDFWRERCSFWLEQSKCKAPRRRREPETSALTLTGHGLSIRVDKGSLLVRDGYTHHPADRREWRFFCGALDLPAALVVLDGSGEITMDAIDWLATQRVPLIRLRWDGQFTTVVGAGGQAASTEKVRWQEDTRLNPRKRLEFALGLIREKAWATVGTMNEHVPRSRAWERAYKNIEARALWLEQRPPRTIGELLGIEGIIASDYFRAWSGVKLKWRAAKRSPIPEDWRKYTSRAALRDGPRRNYRATHPVNAMLNYAYGVLTARTQIKLISEGYDPTIGVMHDKEGARGTYPAFALDRMEPMRPVIDRAVLQLVNTTTFTGADFSIQHDGVCRLNPELGRRVAQLGLQAIGDRLRK